MFRFTIFLGIFVILGYLSTTCLSQDILGCGGFVKSEVEINFSLVEVKLYTKQGSLKYRTDCAPNNGYYMVPVYDKGDYILKVDPPPGWTFEPESVDLHIDGTSDACSKGIDINFQFTGFGVVGKVVSKGQTEGPAGVTLALTKIGSTDIIKESISAEGGEYTFEKILPGEYEVKASHPKWSFMKATTKVTVGRETGNAGAFITIKGYDLTGRVISDGEPIRGVNFVLYPADGVKHDVTECNQGSVPSMPSKDAKGALCYVISGEDGVFTFPSLTHGKYKIVPFYKGDHITFDVVPSEVEVTVNHDSVSLEENFQVAGFSVQGKVLNVAKGSGVSGAHVYLNGKEQAVTKADGTYHLDSMRVGTYTLVVKDRHLFFDPVTVKVTPNTPYLPDITPSRFSLCGRVIIDKVPEGLGQPNKERDVIVKAVGKGSDVTTMKTDVSGEFCSEVAPGDYEVQVVISDMERRAGLKLAPAVVKITITDAPSLSTIFSQFRAKVSGKVTCLENCGSQQISLVSSGRSEENKITQAVGDGKTASFDLKDVMPGTYKVTLMNDQWCWKDKSVDINIVDSDVSDIHFVQSGYILSCSLSHDITLNFAQENKPGNVGSFDLAKGVNKFCLSQPGVYKLNPDSCHMFEQDVYVYDTSAPSVLTLSAVKHRAEGIVVTEEKQKDLAITIKSSLDGESPIRIGPLVSDKNGEKKPVGPFTYKFDYWAKAGEKLDVQVQSAELLFSPTSADVTIRGDKCPGQVVKFEGRKGMFITGQITPALDRVAITIKDKNNDKFKMNLETDKDGKFKIGPLDGSTEYGVTAEREGYVFTEVAGKLGHFNAFKLGEINVMVTDSESNPLQSVLLSLSGSSQYRSNKLTGDNGAMAFLGLSPGQYFLRPMMKEYSFEPASQMISVAEGDTINFSIKGTRIAFSCYGSVTSLNGEAEADLIVEAVGQGACVEYQEESKTEQDGSYRIRGLQPNCEYEVRLKTGDINHHIERAATRVKTVKISNEDLKDISIIAFRRLNQLDLSGNVVASPEHLPTIKIHLYKESNPDSPIHTASLQQNSFFYLPSLSIDNQNYVIRLDSTLSRSSYDYNVHEHTFVANSSHHHFTYTFQPKPRLVDQELSHSSFLVLPFTLLIILLAYHHQKVLPVLGQMLGYFQSVVTSSGTSSQPASTTATTYQINPDLFVDTPTSSKKKAKARKV